MNSILSNAVISIQLGIEDFESKDERRILSAVRNLTSGILLLFKEKLSSLSPKDSGEVLLRQRIKPTIHKGSLSFVGDGKNTVDVFQIEERLSSLGVYIEWKRVKKVIFIRNDVEHYCSNESRDRVKELLADCFIIIRNFITEHLELDPMKLLGPHTWSILLKVSEVYNKELELCQRELQQIQWNSDTLSAIADNIRCDCCQSQLVKPVNQNDTPQLLEFHCSSCGNDFLFEDIVADLVSECYEVDNYLSVKDGGDFVTATCYECGYDTFIISEDKCVRCDASRKYSTCIICDTYIGTDEQDLGGLCSYHHHIAMKDD
jgi:hypothetical protein